jgi:pimeloyl-ACP methyl ester carboxylesterase
MRKFVAVAILGLVECALFATRGLGQEARKVVVSDPTYTKPQQLVDMDHGRRMNLYCRGAGSPAVILDAGLGGSLSTWGLVQPALSKRTKTCSYDRAGLGFSDAATRPSTVANIAEDLHLLLKAAHVKPPYILVGHSSAGMNVRVYADRYPPEVVGLVLVDPSHEDQSSRIWAISAPGGKAKWDAYLAEQSECINEAEKGLVKGTPTYKKCVGDDDPRMSTEINEAQDRIFVTRRWQAAVASERQGVFYESADETRATRRDFGDMPIIVLTHQPHPKADDETEEQGEKRTLIWEELHSQVAAMSSRGINAIVPNANHSIQFDRPQVVIDAVIQAVAISQEKHPT